MILFSFQRPHRQVGTKKQVGISTDGFGLRGTRKALSHSPSLITMCEELRAAVP